MTMAPITAIGFDMGGTLEDIYYDDASRREATRGLRDLLIERDLDPGMPVADLHSHVLAAMKRYQAWREQSEIELPPERIWTEHIFPRQGLPQDRLEQAAEELTLYYETHYHIRCLRPHVPRLLEALESRGYRMAVISNIMSRQIVPRRLVEYGIERFFDPVLTSAEFGWRKPNARIFLEMARRLDVPPGTCAYVGDTVSRDVIGARRAGFALAIQIQSFLTDKSDSGTETEKPDIVVSDLMQVVELLEARKEAAGVY